MVAPSIVHDTFVLKRTYPAAIAKVFAFFADAAKKARWYAADSETGTSEGIEMDFREGGIERTRYRLNDRTPFPGAILANDGIYQDIVPGRRIILATAMTLSGRRISCSLITVELLEADGGTLLILTHQGVFLEGADGPRLRKDGWEQLLSRLGEALTAQ